MTRCNLAAKAALAAAVAIAFPPIARGYTTGETFDLKLPVNLFGSAYGSIGHMQSGEINGQARLWLGRADMQLNMHPAGFTTSVVRSTTGTNHAGYGEPTATTTTNALYWFDRNNTSVVNLHPAGFVRSEALGAGGNQQVGSAAAGGGALPHAMLWTGTAASAVDLTPGSFGTAFATDGDRQVGSRANHAALWNDTAASFVDLNPVGFTFSQALGIGGDKQAGSVTVGIGSRAALWSGTAASYQDLHPLSGYTDSVAFDTNGTAHVGSATTGGNQHAMRFFGGGNFTDLHTLLPGSATRSVAESVDPYGNVAGHATIDGEEHPIVWYNGNMFVAGPNTYSWNNPTIWTSGTPDTGDRIMITPVNQVTVTTTTIDFTAPASPAFNELFVDNAGGGGAIAELHGAGVLQTTVDHIGIVGRGSFVQSGGIHSNVGLILGEQAGSIGIYDLGGGNLNVVGAAVGQGVAVVGRAGAATFNHSGGTHTLSSVLRIGELAGSNGLYNLSGFASVIAPAVSIGGIGAGGGIGGLYIGGGTMTVAGHLGVRDAVGNSLDLDGGTLSVGSMFFNENPVRFVWASGTLEFTNSDPDIGSTGATQLGPLVELGPGKTLRVRNNSQLVRVLPSGTLTFNGGKLDLTDKKLIAHAATAGGIGSWNGIAYTGITGLIDSGRGNVPNGQWNGAAGVVTSDTRAVNSNDLCSIGVATVSQVRNIATTATTTFAGQTVLGSDVVAMFTWGGDANLDGKINIDDYGQIDFNVGSSGSVFGWYNGDFNYDGKINIDDYGIIDFNVAAQNGVFPTAGAAAWEAGPGPLGAGVEAVPEPASSALLAIPLTMAMRRRRSRETR